MGFLDKRAGELCHDAAKARRDGHRVVQLDRLGIRVVRISARFEHLAKNPLLARLGEDLRRPACRLRDRAIRMPILSAGTTNWGLISHDQK